MCSLCLLSTQLVSLKRQFLGSISIVYFWLGNFQRGLTVLCLCTSQKMFMVLYFSQFSLFPLLKFQSLLQLFYRSKILRDEMFLWHLTDSRHRALWKSWKYIWQISSSHLICTSTGYLASGICFLGIFQHTEQQERHTLEAVLLLWWRVCERSGILNLSNMHSVYLLILVSKQVRR